MGLVADLSSSSITFNNPRQGAVFGAIINMFACVMHEFAIEFEFNFDPNPRSGVGGSPATREWWEIGIVQNVVFELINFEYDDGTTFNRTFTNAVLDNVATAHNPFYHDPVIVPACQLDPLLPCSRYIHVMVPWVHVFYTSRGYGELLNPWGPIGDDVEITNKPDSVDMVDEPSFGARKQLQNGAWITVAEHILAFQTWLVAKSPSQVHVLASVGPFSMIFWMTARPSSNLLTIGHPPHSFGFYGQQGIARRVNRSGRGSPASIRLQAGTGSTRPVLQGQTANERGRQWLRTNNLVP